jgi:small-conductance mechanosensitive channel
MEEILSRQYWGNSVEGYLIAAGIIALGTFVVRVFRKVILRRIRKWAEGTTSTNDNYIVNSIERFGIPALYCLIIYSGLNYLDWAPKAERVIQIATGVVILFLCIRLVSSLINLGIRNYTLQHEHGEEKVKQLGGLMILINIALWIAAGVFLIDNLGYDVTAIITGLGIGGIAVALAAQNILGDLFNYFVIFFDRPFEVGDFIIVDDKMGSVEYIGVKTTRIRSLTGEQLVISNSNLTGARIHNHKRQELRRVVFTIDVEYETPLEKLRKLPEGLKRIVTAQPETTFDRAHFAVYKEWSLRFEVVYMVTNSDYNRYMDIQQEMNFQIYGLLEQMGIRFALPTQKLMLDRSLAQRPGNHEANTFSTARVMEEEEK